MRLQLVLLLAATFAGLAPQPAHAFFFWPAIVVRGPVWKVCWTSILGLIFGWNRHCLDSGTGAAAPPPGPSCDLTQTYVFNNKCVPRVQNCLPPNQPGMFRSASRPCTCEASGTAIPGREECLSPQNGNAFCQTASNGQSSECIVRCNTGYTLLTDSTVTPPRKYCSKSTLLEEDCGPGEALSFQKQGEPCICIVPPGNPATTQTCPSLQPPGSPNGQMSCSPSDSGWGTCKAVCAPGFNLAGLYGCL